MREEDLMQRGDALAQRCSMDGVLENQLAMVLAHLKRHRRPKATQELLRALPASPFGQRTQKTRKQFEALERHVKSAFVRVTSWQDAARIVGWAKRLCPVYKQRG